MFRSGSKQLGKGTEWEHVEVVEKYGNSEALVKCVYCDRQWKGGATRIRSHIIGKKGVGVAACDSAPAEVVELFTLAEQQKEGQAAKRQRVRDAESTLGATSANSSQAGPSRLRQATISESLDSNSKAQVDAEVARMFYKNGLPFKLAKDSQFKAAIGAVSKYGPGYAPPSYQTLRTTALQKEKEYVTKQLAAFHSSVRLTKSTITSDGWSDIHNRPLLNFLQCSPKGAHFIKATDTSGQTKSGAFLCQELVEVVKEVGPDNVIQVVTDSAAACKLAGELLETE